MAQPPRIRSPIKPPTGRLPDGILIGALALVLLIVVGVFAYRMTTRPTHPDLAVDRSAIEQSRAPRDRDPQQKFESTSDELKNRGGDETVTRLSDITRNQQAVSGRRVELKDVEVESANGNTFWVKAGADKIAVVAPTGTPALKGGQRVALSGRVDVTDGQVRINATRVDVDD
jgi:hypothetical protein